MNLENVSPHLTEHVLIYLKLQEYAAIDAGYADDEKLYWQSHCLLRLVNGMFPNATIESILEAE